MERIAKGDLVFDIGANRGDKTNDYLVAGARVVSVEPISTMVSMLKERYGNDNRVTIIHAAVSDKVGLASIFYPVDSNGRPIYNLSTLSNSFKKETTKERFAPFTYYPDNFIGVKVITLDYLIEKYGLPSFCKIDVEGNEPKVISGLSKPIKTISFEFTPELLQDAVTCINKLEVCGYKFNYSSQSARNFKYKDFTTGKELIEQLSKIKDYRVEYGDIYAYK